MATKYLLSPDYKLSTTQVNSKEAKDYWNYVLCDQYMDLDCTIENNHVHGDIASINLDGVNLSEAICSPQTLRRQAKHIENKSEENLLVSIHIEGKAQFFKNSDINIVKQGDCILYDTTKPGGWDFYTDFQHLNLRVPKSKLLEHVSADQLELNNPLISGKSASATILREFIQLVARASSHSELDTDKRKKLSEQLILTFCVFINTCQGNKVRIPSEISNIVLKARADKIIKSNLMNRGLNAELIARKLNVSKRYLYKLYENSPMSLSQTVKSQRLEKIAVILTDPDYLEFDSLTDLAFEFGFSDLSHFGRSFKNQYGLSPTHFQQKINDKRA